MRMGKLEGCGVVVFDDDGVVVLFSFHTNFFPQRARSVHNYALFFEYSPPSMHNYSYRSPGTPCAYCTKNTITFLLF